MKPILVYFGIIESYYVILLFTLQIFNMSRSKSWSQHWRKLEEEPRSAMYLQEISWEMGWTSGSPWITTGCRSGASDAWQPRKFCAMQSLQLGFISSTWSSGLGISRNMSTVPLNRASKASKACQAVYTVYTVHVYIYIYIYTLEFDFFRWIHMYADCLARSHYIWILFEYVWI